MNKEYTYLNGKVIISDENGVHTEIDYCDNIDEILVKENLIEEIENKIKDLSNECKKYNIKKKFIPHATYVAFLASAIISPLLFFILTGSNLFFANSKIILFFYIKTLSSFLPLGIIIDSEIYYNHKDNLNEFNGINSELNYLKSQLKKEKENLIKLQNEKNTKRILDKQYCFKTVDDLKQLKRIKFYLNLYYNLGYNENKYYRYFQQGKLDKKLQKSYIKEEIDIAKEYFEEKEKVLVKKKKQ